MASPKRVSQAFDAAGLAQKLRTDPAIARRLAARMGDFTPELQARIKAGDVEAIMEAIRTPPPRAARQTPRQLELPLGDAPAPAAPPASTDMIPFGVRGPGVPVGRHALTPENLADRLQGPQSLYRPQTSMGRPRLLGLPDKRLSTDVDLPGLGGPRPKVWQAMPEDPVPRIEARPQARIAGPVDDTAEQLGRIAEDFAGRSGSPQQPSRGRMLAGAAAAAAGAGAAKLGYDALNRGPGAAADPFFDTRFDGEDETPAIDSTDGTADLAAESAPPPEMPDEPPPYAAADLNEVQFTDRFKRQYVEREEARAAAAPPPVDYSAMARDKISQANAIQRREGRATPESAALIREADALYQKAAEERSAGRGQPIMPSAQADAQTSAVQAEGRQMMERNAGADPRSQARHLLGRINAGEFGNGPERQAAVNEVNRLFAMADAQRYGR